jgi:hypothetical protein
MFKLTSPALFLLINTLLFPQPYQRELDIIPVSDVSGIIPSAFSGGHNNLEHQFVDIDGDGDLDIMYLDSDGTYGWFENTGTKFNPLFKYSMTEIPGLKFSYWYFFIDIDSDGDQDYFTANNDRISLYINEGTPMTPSYFLAKDTVKDNNGDPIFSEYSCNPVFVDIDNDQDYDFISGNTAGTLSYFENIGNSQNFNFKFITDFWQEIYIGPVSNNPLHGASSIDFVDIDDDGDQDLFWGDFFSKSLYVIENQGTANSADMIKVSDIYPVNSDSVYTSGFNMPRFADIDADGDFDLFVSVLYVSTVPQSIMFYENMGTAQSSNQIFQTNDYLKTLDVSNNSSPVFIDIDNDDDLDLFMGSSKYPLGSINFLENIGSKSNPSFYFADSLYFGITGGDLSVVPTFGDLDGDDDFDLVIGKFNGELDVYINSGSKTSAQYTSSFPLTDNFGDTIDVGISVSPFLFDIDGDLDLDLILGDYSGKFSFFRNTGSETTYEFTFQPLYFEGLDVGYGSTPFILDYNKDGIIDLFSGSSEGRFYYFRNDGSNLSPIWNELTDNFINDDFGGYSKPCFVDLDSDSDLDILLGNVKGGLYFYNNTDITNVVEENIAPVSNFEISTYPNPFNPETQIRLELQTGQDVEIEIFNLLGENVKHLFSGYISAGTKTFSWNAKNNSGITLPAGIYFIKVTSHETQKVLKLSFLK